MRYVTALVVWIASAASIVFAQCLPHSPISHMPDSLYRGYTEDGTPTTLRLLWAGTGKFDMLTLDFVPLDPFGNGIFAADTFTVQVQLRTLRTSYPTKLRFPVAAFQSCDQRPIDLILCIEYTAATFPFYSPLVQALRSTLPLLPAGSRITLLFYNHSIVATELQIALHSSIHQLSFLPFPPRSNLSACLRALYHALAFPRPSAAHRRVILHIGRGIDNASLTVTPQDVAEALRTQNARIYFIHIGDLESTALTAALNSVAPAPLYFPNSVSAPALAATFREIFLGLQLSYRAQITHPLFQQWRTQAAAFRITITYASLRSNTLEMADTLVLNALPYQLVATFAKSTAKIRPVFYDQLDRLVELLRTNPDQSILLIGHASNSGSTITNQRLSAARAAAVKRYLVRKGIAARRIHTLGVGDAAPIYPIAFTDWQQELNRRVEIRWLAPALFPYEIYAEQTSVEAEALRLERQWKKRGFNVYIKPLFRDRQTVFQVVLWGFESRAQAEAMRQFLQDRYRIPSLTVVP